MTQVGQGWGLREIMDEVEVLYGKVKAQVEGDGGELRTYRWRPTKLPELPAIWTWLEESPTRVEDTVFTRDTLRLAIVVGVEPRSAQLGPLETLADTARGVLDQELANETMFGLAPVNARRSGMGAGGDEWGDTRVLTMQFGLELDVEQGYAPEPSAP